MKYLLIVLVIAAGYYYIKENPDVLSIGGQSQEYKFITAEELKNRSNEMEKFLCNDVKFQSEIGHTVAMCMKRYEDFKGICDARVFPDGSVVIKTKEEAKALLVRHRKCVIQE